MPANKKDYKISEEEARALVSILKQNWVPGDLQQTVYNLIFRLEKELSENSM